MLVCDCASVLVCYFVSVDDDGDIVIRFLVILSFRKLLGGHFIGRYKFPEQCLNQGNELMEGWD